VLELVAAAVRRQRLLDRETRDVEIVPRSSMSEGGLLPALRQLISGKFFEGRLVLAGKSLAKNFPMLGLGRAILPGSSALQFVSPSSRSRTCGEGRQGSA